MTACDIDGDGTEEVYFLNLDAYAGAGGTESKDQIFTRRAADGNYEDMLTRPENQDATNPGSGRSVACVDRCGS